MQDRSQLWAALKQVVDFLHLSQNTKCLLAHSFGPGGAGAVDSTGILPGCRREDGPYRCGEYAARPFAKCRAGFTVALPPPNLIRIQQADGDVDGNDGNTGGAIDELGQRRHPLHRPPTFLHLNDGPPARGAVNTGNVGHGNAPNRRLPTKVTMPCPERGWNRV